MLFIESGTVRADPFELLVTWQIRPHDFLFEVIARRHVFSLCGSRRDRTTLKDDPGGVLVPGRQGATDGVQDGLSDA